MEIQIVSGFLGSGKTTFINKYLPALDGNTVVIENEFGDISIDSKLIEGDLPVMELASGCICCTLASDLCSQIKEIADEFTPDRIVIEPSGVAKLSEVVKACEHARKYKKVELRIGKLITIVDMEDYEYGEDGFGEFYMNQVENAGLILVRNQDNIESELREAHLADIRRRNQKALVSTDDWYALPCELVKELVEASRDYECAECGKCHDEHDGQSDGNCECEHGNSDHEHENSHDGHHEHDSQHDGRHAHSHDSSCECGHSHEHEHEHDGSCECGHEHHTHDADEFFESTAIVGIKPMSEDELIYMFEEFDSGKCGRILRSKGIVPDKSGGWLHFEYTRSTRMISEHNKPYDGDGEAIVIGNGLNIGWIHSAIT